MKRLLLCIVICIQSAHAMNNHDQSNKEQPTACETIMLLSEQYDMLLEGLVHRNVSIDYRNSLSKTRTKLLYLPIHNTRKSLPMINKYSYIEQGLDKYKRQVQEISQRHSISVPQSKKGTQ